MKTFPVGCPADLIRNTVVEWSELLAQAKFEEALAMFPSKAQKPGAEWSAARLEDSISNYGCPRAVDDPGKHHRLTSLFEQPNPQSYIEKAIDVNRKHLFGLNPAEYVGMVHYDDVPLDGKRSDLTARFHIKKVGTDALTLEFLDIHVT